MYQIKCKKSIAQFQNVLDMGYTLNNAFYSTVFNNSNIYNLCIINIRNAEVEFHFTEKQIETNYHKMIYISKMKKEFIKLKTDYIDLAKMYYSLIDYLQMKYIDVDYMPEYRYLTNYYSMRANNNAVEKIWDRLSWMLCGFGERILRFFLWFAAIIIIPAFGYMLGGINVGSKVVKYSFFNGASVTFIEWIRDFGTCLHFSIVTFSTVGYGNVTPYIGMSNFISAIQILFGLVFIALFTSIVLKRIIK